MGTPSTTMRQPPWIMVPANSTVVAALALVPMTPTATSSLVLQTCWCSSPSTVFLAATDWIRHNAFKKGDFCHPSCIWRGLQGLSPGIGRIGFGIISTLTKVIAGSPQPAPILMESKRCSHERPHTIPPIWPGIGLVAAVSPDGARMAPRSVR